MQPMFDFGPGKVLGDRFEVREPSRQGGLSMAFLAHDRTQDRACELQIFPPSLFDGEQELQEFAASWRPWLRVHSENVLAVHDTAFVGPNALLLVNEVPTGVCLRKVVDSIVPLSEPKVIELGLQLLDGLIEIHSHGLVHGDVKPLTVWIRGEDPNRTAQLVDGGTTPGLWNAKDLGERTALIGTPYYAPVEQFGGDPPTVQSDVYNVATLLFEMATGVQPFAGKTFLDVFQAKLERVPPRIADRAQGVKISDRLEDVIRGGLYADKSQRHPSATAFREALLTCQE